MLKLYSNCNLLLAFWEEFLERTKQMLSDPTAGAKTLSDAIKQMKDLKEQIIPE